MMMILAGRSALGTEAACRAAVEPEGVKSLLDSSKQRRGASSTKGSTGRSIAGILGNGDDAC